MQKTKNERSVFSQTFSNIPIPHKILQNVINILLNDVLRENVQTEYELILIFCPH